MSADAASPLDAIEWPLHTERLMLRRAVADDAPAIYAYRQMPAVSQWLTHMWTDPDAWRSTWERWVGNSIVATLDQHLIGDLRVAVGDAPAQFEVRAQAARTEGVLMWAFHPAFHGRGYATEALRELIRICFSGLALRRLTAICFAENQPSWRLMERVGMRRECHTVRSTLHRDGSWRDDLTYAILAPDA
jgi:RimJ/RimL family protein N-acetyltransferase